MMHKNEAAASYSSIDMCYYDPKRAEDVWQPRIATPGKDSSRGDACSVDSWAMSSSWGSTVSVNSGISSANTTPGGSPAGTPTPKRKKRSLKPALKLNIDDTWTTTKHKRRRYKKNIQASSAKVRAVMRQSRSPQFRFRMVLLTLFALIVSIVSFTWHMYQRQLLQVALGDRIRFHEARRLLHLLHADGSELAEAALGALIPSDLGPHQCGMGGRICEEWKYRARLLVDLSHGHNLSCYDVRWTALARDAALKDCVALRGAHWYGMGLQGRPRWPLGTTPGAHPLVTGDGQAFGGVVDRYWLSSLGVALFADAEAPLHVSMDGERLCLEARGGFPFGDAEPVRLEYSLCTGRNMRTLHQAALMQRRALASGDAAFLEAPVWTTEGGGAMLDQASLQQLANRIMEDASPGAPGFLLLDGRWQPGDDGSLDFDASAFHSPREILQILHHKGFRILLSVHPFVCLPSPAFEEAAEGGHLLTDEWRRVPLLTRYRAKVCGLIDLTGNATASWFLERLLRLRGEYDVDGFVFSGGQASHLPRHYAFTSSAVSPDSFLRRYLALAAGLNGSLLGAEAGFLTQDFPGFVRLTPAQPASWEGLRSVIPAVLTLGLLGYPLLSPGPVGGGSGEVPPRELYLRWLELALFLPVVQFDAAPAPQDEEAAEVLRSLTHVRRELALPAFRRALALFPETGAPLVRPLWWIAPWDATAQACDSQFLVGEELMVAPVLEEGRRSRDVYLPAGWWRDHLLGEVRRGGKWLHNYPVPLTKVAHFSAAEKPL